LDFDDVEAVYRQYLHLDNDPHLLRLVFSIILANRYDGSPLWAMLIGPAGSGKSEMLMSLGMSDQVVAVSSLTPYALASGHGDNSDSLLFELDGRMLVIEDMSTITEMPKDAKGMLYSFLRSAYNGEFVRSTGRGKIVWKGKFGLLAGATPAVEQSRTSESSLGERFLNIRIRVSDDDEFAMMDRADENIATKSTMKKALGMAAATYLEKTSFDPNTRHVAPIRKELKGLAIGVAKARSSVTRDFYTKEVSAPVERGERATRVYLQMQLIGSSLFAMGTDWDLITKIMRRIALDAVPGMRLKVLRSIKSGSIQLKQITADVNMSMSYTQRTCEDLEMLGIIERSTRREFFISNRALSAALEDN